MVRIAHVSILKVRQSTKMELKLIYLPETLSSMAAKLKTGKTGGQEGTLRVRVCMTLPEDLSSQNPHGDSQLSIASVPEIQHPFLVCAGSAHM